MRENVELERALDTFDSMKKQNIEPGLLSYLSIIDLAVNMQQPDIASDLLAKAEKLSTFRVKDQFLYMHVLRCAAYNGMVKCNCAKVVIENSLTFSLPLSLFSASMKPQN